MTERMSMSERVGELNITLTFRADALTAEERQRWTPHHIAWECTLDRDGIDTLQTRFFSSREPTAVEVLDSLASDAATVENARNFEEWASDLGFDTDSRKAERTYEACKESRDELQSFLGEHYDALLWETDRE